MQQLELDQTGHIHVPYPVQTPSLMVLVYPGLMMGCLLGRLIWENYRAFLSLGPGGTSQTFWGFVKVSLLGIFRLKEPFQAPGVLPRIYPKRGYLNSKPSQREGLRPIVQGLAPQRQLTQRASPEMQKATYDVIEALAKRYPDDLFIAKSAIEGHSPALFSKAAAPSGLSQRVAEICHLHGVDGSIHTVLHPADIEKVLDSGYGERHPLARTDWWWQWPVVPEGFVLIYSCRTVTELSVLKNILCAAAWNVCGRDFN